MFCQPRWKQTKELTPLGDFGYGTEEFTDQMIYLMQESPETVFSLDNPMIPFCKRVAAGAKRAEVMTSK